MLPKWREAGVNVALLPGVFMAESGRRAHYNIFYEVNCMEYVAKQGTTALGIIGTALGGLAVAGGSLLAANGGRAANGECSENTPVSRYELGLQQTIAEQGSHIRLLEADKYTDQKIVDVYNAINPQINAIKDELRNIAVYQATNTATISCLGNQVNGIQAVLNGLTKTVIHKSNVCPEPMDRYNSWTAPAAGSTTT